LISIAEVEKATPLPEIARRFGCSGYVVESVPLALYGATLNGRLDFETVLLDLVACGGDADTIASIAGQVMGARIGLGGLPEKMVARTPERGLIETIAGEFAESLGVYERHS
jgi:ADP-ribosylglycohydrolase